jgi:hypothetical protein
MKSASAGLVVRQPHLLSALRVGGSSGIGVDDGHIRDGDALG